MKKTVFTSFTILCLLSTTLLVCLILNTQPVEAGGTIYIKATGEVEGTDKIQRDGAVYTFTDNINDSIEVERDNIVVDGAGYTVQGIGSGTGILLPGRSNVTIENTNINGSGWGIQAPSVSHIVLSRNNITNNNWGGIRLSDSSNCTIYGNNVTNNEWGIYVTGYSSFISISENMLNGAKYSLSVSGDFQSHSIDTSNLVDGKPVYYLVNQRDLVINPATYPEIGYLALINCTNVTVESLSLTNMKIPVVNTKHSKIADNNIASGQVRIDMSSNLTIHGNSIANSMHSVYVGGSDRITISRNNLINNSGDAIVLDYSFDNIVSDNYIVNNSRGIVLWNDADVEIYGNNLRNNTQGLNIGSCSGQTAVYHNNFINNTEHVVRHYSTPVWDNGYPSGGNYWSNYTGLDSDGDGIGDTIHVIDEYNQDNYPLMGMFSDFNATSEHHVHTICNSTISDFRFNGTAISFNVSGEDGTVGFCRTCIPTALVGDTYRVFVNGTEISHTLLPCSDSTHSYLYLTYTHSTQEVTIIPEFPASLILPLLMAFTLGFAVLSKKKGL